MLCQTGVFYICYRLDLLRIFFFFFALFGALFIYHAKYYRGGRKQDDRYEDKYRAAHKELLRESENNSVGRGVEIPIGLAGEEKLMEYLKRAVKVHRRKRSDYTENGKRAAARIEEHIEAEELREPLLEFFHQSSSFVRLLS